MRVLLAAVTVAVALGGCATLSQPASEHLSLHVDSYEAGSGEFKLTLRNDSSRDVMFLHYLVAFSADLPANPVSRPSFPPDEPMMLHDTRLGPGETFEIIGTCSSSGACREAGVHAGIYACWFNSRWGCKEYLRIWSETAINGP